MVTADQARTVQPDDAVHGVATHDMDLTNSPGAATRRHRRRLVAERLTAWLRVVRPRADRDDATLSTESSRHDGPPAPAPSLVRPAAVHHVVDPDGGMLLLRVTGTASTVTVDRLDELAQCYQPGGSVHLDLTDAHIPDHTVMTAFERLADDLERARVNLRIVGVEPDHPALRRRR